MTAIVKTSLAVISCAAVLGGCATKVPKESGFGDVQHTVETRIGQRVQWNQLSPDDRAVASAVHELLAAELTAESAVQVALLNNRNLQATYEDLGVAQSDLVQAGLLRNPVFSIERRFPGQAAEFDLFADFLDLFFIPLRKRIAGATFEATKLRVANEVITAAAETREAFYTLQGAEQMVEMRRSIVRATGASAEAADRLRAAGNITELDLRNEQKLAAQAKLELAAAEAEAVVDRERLNVLMGTWGGQASWTVAPRLPELPDDDVIPPGLESLAVRQRLDLAAARREIESAAQSLGLSRAARFVPELSVGGHFEREPQGDETFGPSIDLPIPLFDQGQATIARGGALLRQAQQRYAALAVEVRSQLRTAYSRRVSAHERAAYYRREVLPLSEQVVQQTQLHYNAMQIGVFQLLQAKQAQIDAGREYIESLRDYWVAHCELEKALGGRLPGPRAAGATTAPSAPPEEGAQRQQTQHQHHGE
jgi:cobalt-zinc-cadmium efflux system outer membrane protein